MIITAKLVAIILGLALTAFTVSTIVLAVQKSNLQDELNEAREKLDMLEQAAQSTSTSTTTTTTTVNTPTDGPTTSVATTTTEAPENINYRLPSTMYPTNYDIYLNPDLGKFNFTGQELITITITQETDQIILHSLNLAIQSVYLTGAGSSTIYVKNFYLDPVREFLVIELSETLPVGRVFRLGIIFEGEMLNKIVGLYSSSYLKEDGSRRTIATSKFEPTYARQAFPCFDEPAMKATFEITLVHPSDNGYHALSNMDIAQELNQGLYKEVYFKKSVAMSTYLACFIISDFAHKSDSIDTHGIGDPFELRVFATPQQINKVNFALDVGKAVIEYYIDYFQIEYPLPKLDMAAIPDFVSGAMEHWGLVTYRETSLLYDETVSSSANMQRVASVIAHEFAHMWFGNLVTMNWWNDLWLNEGFASYIENKGVNAKFPEWNMLDQFIIGTLHGVLSLDATLGSHPIIQVVENPDQITEIFDTITYSKGSSIIRMLEGFLGPAIFQQGVTNYLNKYKFANAETKDFVTEVNNLVDYNVEDIMRTWTEQMGFPVVKVTQTSPTELKLKQERFFSNPDDYNGSYDDSPFNYTWSIPITYKTSSAAESVLVWFNYDQEEITIQLPSAVNWVKLNSDQIGYYRVNYETAMWDNLANQLVNDPSVFTIGDRACLLNDAFALADSTQLPYDVALDMTKYLSKEADYVPWSVAASKLTSLKRTLMFTDVYLDYIDYARALIEPIYESVTWTVGTDHLKNRLRVTVLSAACSLGLKSCLTEVSNEFNDWLANDAQRPKPDVREIIYFYGMMEEGNEQTWEQIWELFITETDASEKSKLMYGLSAVQVPWILSRYIDLAWNENYVRSQDYFTCLQYIAANPIGEPIVWEYVRENWPKLVDRFGLNERYLGNLIPSITARFSTQTKLEEMEYFFAKYPEAGAGTAARVRALETVKNNIVWLENNRDKVANWLEDQKKHVQIS